LLLGRIGAIMACDLYLGASRVFFMPVGVQD
jgi:hypothetical protein